MIANLDRRRFSMRPVRSGSCFLVALILVAAAHFPVFGQDKIRIGLSSVSATNGSVWVAEEKGLFKKYGVDAEVIVIGGGGARVVSSLIAGEIQFSVGEPKAKGAAPKAFADDSLVREIDASGLIKKFYEK
jgi:ABC-type nitrate/sulfonate/bicarbonate transport system substrate-binding protein